MLSNGKRIDDNNMFSTRLFIYIVFIVFYILNRYALHTARLYPFFALSLSPFTLMKLNVGVNNFPSFFVLTKWTKLTINLTYCVPRFLFSYVTNGYVRRKNWRLLKQRSLRTHIWNDWMWKIWTPENSIEQSIFCIQKAFIQNNAQRELSTTASISTNRLGLYGNFYFFFFYWHVQLS